MSKPIADKLHARHYLLFGFDRGSNATQVAKNISTMCGEVISYIQSQKWFERFESGDRCL